jgi:uncharacterized protein YdhG (YjbR/CyaY superfamily)
MMKIEKPNSVDEYISSFSGIKREILEKLRLVIKKSAPEAEEVISYQMPAYQYKGPLVYFAAHKNHIGFYPTSSPIIAFKDELLEYEQSKGAIKFPFDKPIPYKLVEDMVKYKLAENKTKEKKKSK